MGVCMQDNGKPVKLTSEFVWVCACVHTCALCVCVCVHCIYVLAGVHAIWMEDGCTLVEFYVWHTYLHAR